MDIATMVLSGCSVVTAPMFVLMIMLFCKR